MNQVTSSLHQHFDRLKKDGSLHVVYALLAETLFLGLLAFVGLFTIETLLPTFVTVRFSITKFFLGLSLLTFLLAALGQLIDIEFTLRIKKTSPLLWLGMLWAFAILTISLYKFPLFLIPFLILGFFATGYLFVKIFLEEK